MKQMEVALRKSGLADKPGRRTFGQILCAERDDMGATWQQVANNVGAHKRDVRAWETNEAAPDARQLRKLFAMFPRLKPMTIDLGIIPPVPVPASRIVPAGEVPASIRAHAQSVQAPAEPPKPVIISPKPSAVDPKTVVSIEQSAAPDAPISPVVVKTRISDQFSAIEPITPDLAALLLQGNVRNRKISGVLVDALARDMQTGNWKLTHQGIALDKDGRLLDGQHRLTAVVKSGCTVKMLVTYNVVPDAFEVVDVNNRPRSMSDIFGLAHGTKNNTATVAALKVIDRFGSNDFSVERFTFAEIDALFERYGSDVQWAASRCSGSSLIRGASVVAGLAYCRPCAPELVSTFADGIVGQVGMSPAQAALRKAVERISPCKSQRERIDLALIVLRCVYAHEKDEKIDKVYLRDQDNESKDGRFRHFKHWRARREKLGLPT